MPNATTRAISGLQPSPNPFSNVPEGALLIGDEVVARAPGVLESRRGKRYSTPFNADRCFPFPTTSQMFCTQRGATNPLVYNPDTDSVYNLTRSSGPFAHRYPYGADPRVSCQAAAANGNIYFTTAFGIQVAPGINNPQWRCAGLPVPYIDLGSAGSGSAVMPTNTRRTYRATIGFYDELGNFNESAPSPPFAFDNSGAAVSPSIGIFPGLGAPPNCVARLYRSLQGPLGVLSSDEMFLVAQASFLSAALGPNGFVETNGNSIGVNDQSVDTLLTIPLYTNSRTGDGQGGIAGANYPPPAAGTIAFFKGRMYFGRCTFRQQLQVQVVGTGTGGIVAGDTITIDGNTYTAVSAAPGANQYIVRTVAGDVANNLDTTAKNIARLISLAYMVPGFYTGPAYGKAIQRQLRAQYISLGGSDFGRILIERIFPTPLQDDPGIGFGFASSGAGFNFPNGIPTSTDNYIPGSVAWSKPNKPEAVPNINTTVVGDATAAVLAFSVHRDVMVMWKEDGVWLVRDDGGPQPTFSQLDSSVNVIAPASVAVVDNASYALTDRGVLQVTEQGTIPVGEPIRTDLTKLLNLSQNALAQAYGIGYDSERLYVLALPASPTEAGSSIQYVLRVPDAGFPPQLPRLTRFLHQGTLHGMVLPRTSAVSSNRLAFVYAVPAPGSNLLNQPLSGAYIERKGGVVSMDFVDFTGTIANPASTTTNQLVFSANVYNEIFPGDLFTYNPLGPGTRVYTMRVLSVDHATVTLDNSYPFTAGGTLNYFRGIQCHWRHAAITLGEPTAEKQWSTGQVFFDYFDGDWLTYLMDSEKAPLQPFSIVPADPQISNFGGTALTSSGVPGWSLPGPNSPPSPVGQVQWLRNVKDVVFRVDPGRAESRAARLGAEFIFAQALASFRLTAFSASAHEWKERATR